MNRYQEMKAQMKADTKLNREAAEQTIVVIKDKLRSIEDRMDLMQEKKALTRLLNITEKHVKMFQSWENE